MAGTIIEITSISEITKISARVNVSISGGSDFFKGLCWATHSEPTKDDTWAMVSGIAEGSLLIGQFGIPPLQPNTTYYVRPYVENDEGVSYGEVVFFKTLAEDDPVPDPEPLDSYGVRFRLETRNIKKKTGRLDIEIDGYAGNIDEIEGTEDFFILKYQNEKSDKRGYVRPTEAEIRIYEDENFNIDELKITNETHFRITFYENDIVRWQGFVVPDFYSTEIGENMNVISMVATDRLASLKDATIDVSGQPKQFDVLFDCLQKTGLNLNLNVICDFETVGGKNVFNTSFDAQRLKDDKGRNVSCYDIIRSMLVETNSYITQRYGAWFVVNKRQQEIGTANIHYYVADVRDSIKRAYTFQELNFDKIQRGARRNIIPVAASVGIFQEIGGGKLYPENFNFRSMDDWSFKNGFTGTIDNRHVTLISPIGGVIYGDETDNYYLYNNNQTAKWYIDRDLFHTAPYAESDPIDIIAMAGRTVEISIELNGFARNYTDIPFMIIADWSGEETLQLNQDGEFVPFSFANPEIHYLEIFDPYERGGYPLSAVFQKRVTLTTHEPLDNYKIKLRVFGSNAHAFITSFSVKFNVPKIQQKGNIYKVEQGDNFTFKHEIETTIFGDYLTAGVNGYFYNYQPDDTSSLLEDGERTQLWTAPEDGTEQPLLLHTVRQMARMFSIAHDQIRGNLDTDFVDPLKLFRCGNEKYVMTEGVYSFMREQLEVVLEQVKTAVIWKKDYIYSHFDKDEDKGIRGIAGISESVSETGGVGYHWNLHNENIEEEEGEDLKFRISRGDIVKLEALGILIETERNEEDETEVIAKFIIDAKTNKSVIGTGTEADPIELKGDEKNPGALKYYGTDDEEEKGYHDFPEMGGDYKWNLKGKGVLPEISNIQIIQDADSGDYWEAPDAFFGISAFNKHGETIPQFVPAFKMYSESFEAIITWDLINGADGYYVYAQIDEDDGLWMASERFEVLNNEFDLMNPDYPIAQEINLTEKLQKNTAVSDAVISFEIKDDDTVKVEAENAIVVVTESEDKKEKNLLIKIEKPDIPDLDDAKRWWNLGTGEGLENVPGIKFTQEKRNEDFDIWKNHLFISAYNSNGETLPLPVVDDFKMYLEQNYGIINWSKLPNADGYYLYLGVGGGVINGDAVNLSWYKYDIDDNNITEIDLQDLYSYSFVQVSEIPTENTTGFSEFRIEHEDLLEIEGDGIDVELTTDGRRKKLKLSAEGGGGGGSGTSNPELHLDFEEVGDEFTYNVPYNMKFTSMVCEGTDATLDVALNTNLARYDRLTITATAAGLVSLYGVYV